MGKVTRTGDGARIEGVPELKWGLGKDCTFIGALESALAVTDNPLSYSNLMGLSGLAFRMRWWDKDSGTAWCPSCAVGEMPEEQEWLGKVTGWRLPTDTQFGEENEDKTPIIRKIMASIDQGLPVVGYVSCLDVATIYGYSAGGRILLARDYNSEEPELNWPAERIGPLQSYLEKTEKPGPAKKVFLRSLKLGLDNYRRGAGDGGVKGRKYLYGSMAFDYWKKDAERFDTFSPDDKDKFLFVSSFVLTMLYDARKSAVKFLKEHAGEVSSSARGHLEKARGIYEKEVADILTAGEGEQGRFAPWKPGLTRDGQTRQAAAIAAARDAESAAIAEIEKALQPG